MFEINFQLLQVTRAQDWNSALIGLTILPSVPQNSMLAKILNVKLTLYQVEYSLSHSVPMYANFLRDMVVKKTITQTKLAMIMIIYVIQHHMN